MGIGVTFCRFRGLCRRAVLLARVGGGKADGVAGDLVENSQNRSSHRARDDEADNTADHTSCSSAIEPRRTWSRLFLLAGIQLGVICGCPGTAPQSLTPLFRRACGCPEKKHPSRYGRYLLSRLHHPSTCLTLEFHDSHALLGEKSLEIFRNVAIGDQERALGQVIARHGEGELLFRPVVRGETLLAIRSRFAERAQEPADELARRQLG